MSTLPQVPQTVIAACEARERSARVSCRAAEGNVAWIPRRPMPDRQGSLRKAMATRCRGHFRLSGILWCLSLRTPLAGVTLVVWLVCRAGGLPDMSAGIDTLLVCGGPGAGAAERDERLIGWLRDAAGPPCPAPRASRPRHHIRLLSESRHILSGSCPCVSLGRGHPGAKGQQCRLHRRSS